MAEEAQKKDKLVAGILAILLGCWGVHLFYLGCQKKALYYLLCWVAGVVFSWTFILGILCVVPAVLGIIDGIHYLTDKDQEAFEKRVEDEKLKIFNWNLK